ncbi:MAG: hypothetical protein VKI63_02435 [Cyanobium sp.]|nr:hypothetical protein [Cyanobium sp.]
MSPTPPFSRRRLQALCRLGAYALLVEFLINLLRRFLPLPTSLEPVRLLGLIDFLLTISSMALLVVVLLFAGLADGVRPARWEWWLARLLRPLLALIAVLYVLLIPPSIVLSHQIRTNGEQALQTQTAQRAGQLKAYRNLLEKAADAPGLRRLIEAQPQMRQALSSPDSPFADPSAPLPQQRQLALRVLDRLEIGLQEATLKQRADAAGQLQLELLRLCGLSLVYGFFFALVSPIWPFRLGPMPEGAGAPPIEPPPA